MAYGQGDDLAEYHKELATIRKQLEETKQILLQAALGEDIKEVSRSWLETNAPELTVEAQAPKKKWE